MITGEYSKMTGDTREEDNVLNIHINCCNNILSGDLKIHRGKLNIKYGINGTGKSTIAKVIEYTLSKNLDELKSLTPFRYIGNEDETKKPFVVGLEEFSNTAIFDESYINQYIYMPDELIKNSFEIFIKNPEYDRSVIEIEHLISEIAETFKNDTELDGILIAFEEFIKGFGNAASGYSAAGALAKGLGKGNKILNVPKSLVAYTPYLRNTENGSNIRWLHWQQEGSGFLDIATDQCPFCTASVKGTRETILKVSEEYNPKNVEHLNKIMKVFQSLATYFSPSTNEKIEAIINNISGLAKEHQQYLVEIKNQVIVLNDKLKIIKSLNPASLREIEIIGRTISEYKIDFSVFSHLQSGEMKLKIEKINMMIDSILSKAGMIQGKVNQQRILIKRAIEEYSNEINDFLHYAGYKYVISIDESKDKTYKLLLRYVENNEAIQNVKTHLSYGERNAFALVLFMYSSLKSDCDLIVLDDPVSSFDGNKQFAILNMLFMGKRNFKEKTVVVLTHDFNFVIDSIYNLAHKILPYPKAAFLNASTDGLLTEIEIKKDNIQSIFDISLSNISSASHILCKLVYLRRLLEIQCDKNYAWQLLSNIFKKREQPEIHENDTIRIMTEEEIHIGTGKIINYVFDFDYNRLIQLTKDSAELVHIYKLCTNNYEKLHIYRIIKAENSSNDIVKKFVNETFHVENDFIFQLNPRVYITVPQYIIDECDKDLEIE